MTDTQHLLAAYTAAPADPADADRYYAHVVANAAASVLGLGWKGADPAAEIAHRAAALPEGWTLAVNSVPGTFRSWADDHRFGLASPDEDGRRAAVDAARQIAATAARLADAAGRSVVGIVELHAAPGFTDRTYVADAGALAASLEEVAGLDWAGAGVSLEHCDAYVDGQTPAKGFLPLDEELAVLAALDGAVGISLNWGRSVIETRSAATVVDHVRLAAASGHLRGITFSGTADQQTVFGPAWADSHLALADGTDEFAESASLLTTALVAESAAAAGPLAFVGAKTNWPADRTDPIERAESVLANHRAVRDAASSMTGTR